MLTIYHKDLTYQVIRVNPEFFSTQVQGKGNNKRIITPEDKARSIMLDLNGCGYSLTYNESKTTKHGFIPSKHFQSIRKGFGNKGKFVKKIKSNWKKSNYQTYSLDLKHGLTIEQSWKKNCQKTIIASSTTQLL